MAKSIMKGQPPFQGYVAQEKPKKAMPKRSIPEPKTAADKNMVGYMKKMRQKSC
jgi:hypothetical protein